MTGKAHWKEGWGKTIGWNVLAPEGSKFGSASPPLCSALRSSPPTLCHPTCISLFVPSSLLIRHLRSASSPRSPPAAQSNRSSFNPPLLPLNHLTIRQEDCCSWCIIVPTTSTALLEFDFDPINAGAKRRPGCSAGCPRRCAPIQMGLTASTPEAWCGAEITASPAPLFKKNKPKKKERGIKCKAAK